MREIEKKQQEEETRVALARVTIPIGARSERDRARLPRLLPLTVAQSVKRRRRRMYEEEAEGNTTEGEEEK